MSSRSSSARIRWRRWPAFRRSSRRSMRHDLHIEGQAFRLRPVTADDGAAIVELRNQPDLSRFINPTSADPADQRAWLDEYHDRAGDYYFIVEGRDAPSRARSRSTMSSLRAVPRNGGGGSCARIRLPRSKARSSSTASLSTVSALRPSIAGRSPRTARSSPFTLRAASNRAAPKKGGSSGIRSSTI